VFRSGAKATVATSSRQRAGGLNAPAAAGNSLPTTDGGADSEPTRHTMRFSNWSWAVWVTATAIATGCSSDDESSGNPEGDAATTGGSSGSGTGGSATGGGGSSTGGSSTGGSSAGGSATGGSSGTGGSVGGAAGAVGAGGAAGATGAAGAGNSCDQLDACCATTSAPLRTQCQTIASTGMLAQCSAVLGIFCNGGTGLDGGTGDAGGGCAALQQCCAALSGIQRTQCEVLAGSGNDMQCDTVAFLYCP